MLAKLIIIALCLIAVTGVIGLALQTGQRRGWVSPRGLAALLLAVVVVVLAVWSVVVVFDDNAGAAGPAGVASNAGPMFHVERPVTAGVAAPGTCDDVCQLAWLGRRAGVML